jgi:branched-chain amino acid transport system substrate-binding protein
VNMNGKTKVRGRSQGTAAGRRALLALLAVFALCLALVAAACDDGTTATTDDGSAATAETIVIGAIVSANGAQSALGIQERNVLEMMEGYVNAQGGVLGRDIDIIIEDDNSDAQEAVTAANRLIDGEHAVALIAATGSPSTMAVKEITAERQLPQIAMAAANAITNDAPMEWIWRTPHKDAMAVARALEYVSEILGVTRIAVLHDENTFGSSGQAEIASRAADYGLQIVATESYRTDDTDLRAQLTSIDGQDPEALIVWGTSQGAALAALNMQQLGMEIPYIGSHGIANAKFIELAGAAAEGIVFPAGRLLVPSSITNEQQREVTNSFIELYENEWGETPNTFAGYAYEAVMILVDAIERAGSTDPEAIQAALNQTQGFVGPDGVYNYSETNHDGLTAEDMIIVKIEDGDWVLVE